MAVFQPFDAGGTTGRMDRVQWVAAAMLVVVAAGAGLWFGRPLSPPPAVDTVQETAATGTITVHVAGLVIRPGLVEVAVGSRVADVVEAAGGFAAGADRTRVNLAAPVVDGQQVVVYPNLVTAIDDAPVVVNRATAAELESIPGVGQVLANRIVSYRDKNGFFTTVEDLLDVAGIGEAKLAAMRDFIQIP